MRKEKLNGEEGMIKKNIENKKQENFEIGNDKNLHKRNGLINLLQAMICYILKVI